MEIFDDDLNAEVIGFGALNVDKLYSVENIADSKVVKKMKLLQNEKKLKTVIFVLFFKPEKCPIVLIVCRRRQWQPTPVFLPGEPQGQGSLVGCCLWGRTESDTTEET